MTVSSHTDNSISIRCYADGYSFYAPRGRQGECVHERRQLPVGRIASSLLDDWVAIVGENVSDVRMLAYTAPYRLVPQELYREGDLLTWVRQIANEKVMRVAVPMVDMIDGFGAVNVYVVPLWVNEVSEELRKKVEQVDVRHHVSDLLVGRMEREMLHKQSCVRVRLMPGVLTLVVLREGQLVLANDFRFDGHEEAAYHILNCYEQLGLSHADVLLKLEADEPVGALKTVLSEYIRMK